MEKQFEFNTGRMYSNDGQRIVVRYTGEKIDIFGRPAIGVTFYDYARGIGGDAIVDAFTAESVMDAYDNDWFKENNSAGHLFGHSWTPWAN
jgi:hypothetical protein